MTNQAHLCANYYRTLIICYLLMYKTNAKAKQKRKRMPDKLKCMRNVDHRLKSGTIQFRILAQPMTINYFYTVII